MKRKTLILLMISIAVLFLAALVKRGTVNRKAEVSAKPAAAKTGVHKTVGRDADVRLALTDLTTGQADLNFEIVNMTSSTLVCPDSWYLEFEDGTRTMLSLPQAGNIRVEPGQKGNISIARPVQTNSWRLGAGYYLENLVFDVKVRLEQSSLKNHLPAAATAVQGKIVVSDWVR